MAKSRRNRKHNRPVAGGSAGRARSAAAQSTRGLARNEATTLIRAGNAKRDAGDYDGAITDYEQAIDTDAEIALARRNRRDIARAYANRGNDRTNIGDYSGAREDYKRAIALCRDAKRSIGPEVASLLERGVNLQRAGDHDDSIVCFDRIIALDPNFELAYWGRGDAKNIIGDYIGAIADYDITLELNPDFARAYCNRGDAKNSIGDYIGAIADYDRALKLNLPDPAKAMTYRNRGVAKNRIGDRFGAIADYDRALKLNPDDAITYHNRGYAKKNIRDYDGAIADYDRALELNPDFARAYCNRGDAKDSTGDRIGAIADYDRALKLAPDDAKIYHNRGVAKNSTGDRIGAIADYDRAIELNPDFAESYRVRGFSNINKGEYQQALADFYRAIELNPEDMQAYCGRGMVKAMQKDYDEALANFDQAATCYDDLLSEQPERLRLFYDLKEHIAGIVRAAERARAQFEADQLLEVSEAEREEAERRAEAAETERHRLLAQIEQLSKALAVREPIPEDAPLHLGLTRVQYYSDKQGREPYTEWITEELGRAEGRRVRDAVAQMRKGNFGDCKPLHARGLFERRLVDSGLRIYFARLAQHSVLILGGGGKSDQQGDKSDQSRDIAAAEQRLADWRARHPQ